MARRGDMTVLRSAAGLLAICLVVPGSVSLAQEAQPAPQERVLDRVIAVVNSQVILESDLQLEQHLARLLPINGPEQVTPAQALERLTTRALIEQQILQEDPHGLEIAPTVLADSLAKLRENLPACRHGECETAAGWTAFLATLGLTPVEVSEYWAHRIAVLGFIEQRFRSGIRITPEEIEKYYRETLVPQYAKPGDAPPLNDISQRVQEILLQQRVNGMLSEWLKSLQDQGQVEILDPSLRAPAEPPPAANSPDGGLSGAAGGLGGVR